MNKTQNLHYVQRAGFTLIEVLLVILFGSIALLAGTSIISSGVLVGTEHKLDLKAKQKVYESVKRISERIQKASYVYPIGTSVSVSAPSFGIVDMTVGDEGIVILIPKFDSSGEVIQSSGDTYFTVICYYTVAGDDSGEVKLIEASDDMYIAASPDDARLPDSSNIPTSFTLNTYTLAGDLLPAIFTDMGTDLFSIETNASSQIVSFALVSQENKAYIPHSSGSATINDAQEKINIVLRNS